LIFYIVKISKEKRLFAAKAIEKLLYILSIGNYYRILSKKTICHLRKTQVL